LVIFSIFFMSKTITGETLDESLKTYEDSISTDTSILNDTNGNETYVNPLINILRKRLFDFAKSIGQESNSNNQSHSSNDGYDNTNRYQNHQNRIYNKDNNHNSQSDSISDQYSASEQVPQTIYTNSTGGARQLQLINPLQGIMDGLDEQVNTLNEEINNLTQLLTNPLSQLGQNSLQNFLPLNLAGLTGGLGGLGGFGGLKRRHSRRQMFDANAANSQLNNILESTNNLLNASVSNMSSLLTTPPSVTYTYSWNLYGGQTPTTPKPSENQNSNSTLTSSINSLSSYLRNLVPFNIV